MNTSQRRNNNSSSFSDDLAASRVLFALRHRGHQDALDQLYREYRNGFDGPLIRELHIRLLSDHSPTFLIDGVWLNRGFGGISRVWGQILSTFSLPDISSPKSKIILLDPSGRLPSHENILSVPSASIDPCDFSLLEQVSIENHSFVDRYSADVFCSTWITSSGLSPSCPEVALIHDFIPERFTCRNPLQLKLRKRWISGASSSLSVSQDTCEDLSNFYPLYSHHNAWCHLAPDSSFSPHYSPASSHFWSDFKSQIGIRNKFILLPGSAKFGSYKNPDIIALAISHHSLSHLDLLISGIDSENVRLSILKSFPELANRIFSAGFSDFELNLIYKHSLAVVLPSLIEGYGLPAVEAIAAGGIALISDARGLREAGSEAALRFNPSDAKQLIDLLHLVDDPLSREWLLPCLRSRISNRLQRLNPDLIGLALLAQSRQSFAAST